MPKGFEAAKKVGDFSGRGTGFVQKPRGIRYFKLENDQETAVVRFLQQHADIEWVRQWKTAPKPGFPYGEKLNCVDQLEEGIADPGVVAGLKNAWTAYLPLIWRNAPAYAKDAQGNFVKDGNDNLQLIGYTDCIAIWEMPYQIYAVLADADANYQGLMSRDMQVKRNGVKGNAKTTYNITPFPIDGPPTAFTPQDTVLAQTQMPDIRPMIRIPTYDELFAYLNGGVTDQEPIQPQPQFQPQPGMMAQPPQAQPALPAWPAQPGVPAPVVVPAPMAPPPVAVAPPPQPTTVMIQDRAGQQFQIEAALIPTYVTGDGTYTLVPMAVPVFQPPPQSFPQQVQSNDQSGTQNPFL